MVRGAAGVGKTRLTTEALTTAGLESLVISATSTGKRVPLGAFAAWVDHSVSDPLSRVSGVVTEISKSDAVVVIDDFPRLDDLSLFVVSTLWRSTQTRLMFTIRTEDRSPATDELLTGDEAIVIELAPMSEPESADLVEAALGGTISPELHHTMWELGHGNPFLLRALVNQGRDQGLLTFDGEEWIATGPLGLPDGLVVSLSTRLEAHPDVAEVVDALAIAEPLPLSAVTELVDHAAVEKAVRRDFVVVDVAPPHHKLRLSHPIYGEVRRTHATVQLHRIRPRLSRILSASNDSDPIVAIQAAVLALESGDFPGRQQILADGAEAALGSLDTALAIALAQEVTAPDLLPRVHKVLGYAMSLAGAGLDAEAVLQRASDAATDPDELATTTMVRVANQLWTLGDLDAARQIVDDLRTDVPLPEGIRSTVTGLTNALAGRPRTAFEMLTAAPHDTRTVSPLREMLTCWAGVIAAGDLGLLTEVSRFAARGYTAADSPDTAPHLSAITQLHAYYLMLAGNMSTAYDVAERLTELTTHTPGFGPIWATGVTGSVLGFRGDLKTATRLLTSALEQLDCYQAPPFMWIPFCIERASAAAMSGDTDTLVALTERLRAHPHPAFGYLHTRIELLEVWQMAMTGETSNAARRSLDIASTAKDSGQDLHEAYALQVAVRLGDASCAPRLSQLAQRLTESPRVQIAARHAHALASGDGKALDGVADEYLHVGLVTCAADASAQAVTIYESQGRRGARLNAVERLDRIAAPRGIHSPATTAAHLGDGLSARQREVVMLAQSGLTNREIAARLTLSVRTVEGHLYRATQILGGSVRDVQGPDESAREQ
ncbi:helix-turn-helix transcriptional regulator [Gordonia desulfuricans]|uniref:Helix-turn-helix transcriptional regulator n=1 Tax=Gordonia desulfuricans TaxID=89051 RepID=A0A7K3LJT2_9ACTN|nr:sigma factor-like helix-turn-helix DNA-binding protein [Gordonia desulfuricans]NDK88515.1 helix-turn-helix transcriptional regulator [Gordonia desulfuricans]